MIHLIISIFNLLLIIIIIIFYFYFYLSHLYVILVSTFLTDIVIYISTNHIHVYLITCVLVSVTTLKVVVHISDRVPQQLRLAWHSVELPMHSVSPTSLEIQVRKKVLYIILWQVFLSIHNILLCKLLL